MDYRDKKTFHNSGLRSSLLARLIAVLMAVSMVVPYQSLAVYAVQNEPAAASEETADQAVASENQEEPGEAAGRPAASEDKEDPKESPDQSEAAETRDSSEQASGDQKQEDAKTQNNNASGGNTVSEEGKQPSESSSPAKKASVNDGSQADRQSDGTDNEGNEGGATGKTAEDQADRNYGPDGVAKTIKVELTKDRDTAYAGDQISYNVNISMWAAATYPYDGQNQEVMFSEWENIKIYLDMPEHVRITGIKQPNVGTATLIDESTNTWEIVLNNDTRNARNSNSINFDVNTKITGNGELKDGETIGTAEVTVSTDFNVRIDEEGNTKQYSKTVTDETGTIALSSPDKWIMTKSSFAKPNNYSIDTDAGTVTVHYLIKYGLNVNDVPVDDEKIYTRTGRAPFDHDITLTDTPTLTLHNGRTLDAKSATVTPAKTGYIYKDGSSADEGGKAKAIKFDSGDPVNLPYAVVGQNQKEVAENAPAYSEYKVDMVYDYDEFMVWYYENADKTDADSHNDAIIEYQILGRNKPETTDDDAETTIPGYIEPGLIEIDKYIVNYNNDNKKLYSKNEGFTANSAVSGPATYEVFKEDGTKAKLYYKDAFGKYHELSTGNTVTIDPVQAASFTNGAEGKISFYLDAGTYNIKETVKPANTEAQGEDELTRTVRAGNTEPVTAVFDNKEKLGEILIHKKDDTNNHLPIQGAVFGLYEDRAHSKPVKDESGQDYTVITDSVGDASFTRIVPGNYYLYEISVPSDFVKSEDVTPVTVTAGAASEADVIELENHSKKVPIKLIKKYSTVNAPETYNEVTDDFNKFANAFLLQYSDDGGVTWNDKGVYNIDENGEVTVRVDEVNERGTHLMYRFKETVPAGYFSEDGRKGDGLNVKVDSYSITPADGNDDAHRTIIMKNKKGGSITLTKNKWSVNNTTGSYSRINDQGKRFTLYRVAAGSTEAEAVGPAATTDTNGRITFSDLISSDADGKAYTYYVVEQNTDAGYTWITDSFINIDGTRTAALEIGSFVGKSSAVMTKTANNIQQKISIGIIKKDKLTESTTLPGATFDVTDADGTKIASVTSTSGTARFPIEIGQNYTITETSVPAGYYLDAEPQEIKTVGWKVGMKADGSIAIYDDKGQEVKASELVYTFEDTPYQRICLTKQLKDKGQADDKATSLNGVTFSVYVKKNGQFEPYKDADGNIVTINANHEDTVALPAGDYYLHEDTTLGVVVHPDQFPDLYTGKGEYDETNKRFYFGKYPVVIPEDGADKVWYVDPIINIANVGDLVVHKVLYDKNNQLVDNKAGFTMKLFTLGEDGTTLTPVRKNNKDVTATTNKDGEAAFIDLPVYDSNGKKIKYVVEEVYNSTQQEHYYTDNFRSDGSPKELTLDATVDAGKVENHEYMSVKAIKKYYDAREHELTGLEYELEGATIALYSKKGNEYKFIRTGVTNSRGEITFSKLEYSADGFVAIEVSVPDRPEYKYMVPVKGTYLKPDAQGNFPETLTAAQVSELSKVDLTSNTNPEYTGTIYNVIPWTQIHVTKYDQDKTDKKLNGANFTLYKQVLPEDQHGGELSFDADNCTVVGEYTSGTWIHNDQQMTGEFQTDVLENADNIVYWLVETKAPTGYSILDEYKYVLFPRKGTNYTNNSNDGKSTLVYTGGLKDNEINYFDVYNKPGEGPGTGTENWAFIEFNKWRQKEDTADKDREDLLRSDFALMPNSTFKLYAVNKETDNTVLLLDTITTGDENLVDGSGTTGYGVSRSLDAWAIFDEIEKKYPDQLSDIITYHSSDDSGHPGATYPYVVGPDGKRTRIKGTFTLNATLIEVSASSKYELDLHHHNMQITFIPSALSVGNDKYAVPNIQETDDQGGYTSDLCDNDGRRSDYEDNKPRSMAIVDYLAVDNAVVLHHYGYDPEQVRYDKTHAELEAEHDAAPGLFVSEEVTFALEKLNTATNRWEAWSPSQNQKLDSGSETFTADGNRYQFENGLDPGEYRVIMKTPADGYENFYPDAATAFHFTVVVSDRTQTFNTYSPSRPKLTIRKVDLSKKTIDAAATFRLQSVSGASYNESATTSGGKAEFAKGLPANAKFKLTETAAPSGYTNAYFVQLFKAEYPGYAKLVEGNEGYAISYEAKVRENGEMYIVDKEYLTDFSLTVPNVKNVSVKLTKTDLYESSKHLKDAEFTIYYRAFNTVKGSYTVPDFPEGGSGWTKIGTVTTGEDGTVTKSGLKPGVYHVLETGAPEHYDISAEAKAGKTIVMTGGLDLQISSSDKYQINTDVGGTGSLEFKDPPKVPIVIKKTVELGSLPARDYEFQFTLKDSDNVIPGDPDKASKKGATVTDAKFADLSQGGVYYLTEAEQEGYQIKEVRVGNKVISPETTGKFKGSYAIEIPTGMTSDQAVEVEVTNTLLEARVTILKYDGVDGTPLTGALFDVLKSDGKTVVEKANVTDNGDGSYTAVIPLESTTPATYFIHETRAPEIEGKKYTIDENNSSVRVDNLGPGDDVHYQYTFKDPDNKYVLPNYQGVDITITKYNGIPGHPGIDVLAGAEFQMYFSTDDGANWSTWHPSETTGSDGKATFRILPGYTYAIAEVNDVAGYVGLYGVYDGDTKLDTTVSSDEVTLYKLGKEFQSDTEYEFQAYNTPYLRLKVVKEDISGKVSDPNVNFHVYEVPAGTKAPLTEEQIADLSKSKVYIGSHTTKSTYTNEQFIRPGKTYLAVEDKAFDPASQFDDYSIIKDDSRVVTYEVFSVPETNYKEEYTVTFVNNKGDASIDLKKDVDKDRIDSLTVKEAELTYTLTPTSTNGYALNDYTDDQGKEHKAFRVNDSGLTATPADATLAPEWYNITEVIVGQGSMVNYLKRADQTKKYKIEATVTFVDFDGNEYKQKPVNVTQGDISVVPTGTSGKNIKSFYVDYSSPDLKAVTGYDLGQNFKANPTVVKATVFKQEKPEEGVVTAITKITDNADAEISYTPWSPTGEKKKPESLTAADDAVTVVDGAKAPKIRFEKSGPDPDTAVDLDSDLTYRLKVTNISEEDLVFTDPIIVDLLPQGMVVNQAAEFVSIVSKPTTISDNYTVTAGYAGDSQYVNIIFSGTVAKGESIEVDLTAHVTSAVTNYGNYLKNYAFTTSKEVGVATSDNVTGAVIKDDEGLWASELVELAAGLNEEDPTVRERAEKLKEKLGKQGTYGYLGDWHENFWVTENQLICLKEEYGPSDGGVYRTDKVAVLTNDKEDDDQRTMHYRLTINNLSESKRTNLAVMDIMPVVGDNRINNTPRGSNWPLYFSQMVAVKVNNKTCTDYTIYYYSGKAEDFDADDITAAITEAKAGLPSGWSMSDPGNATAIIVAFNYDPTDDAKCVVLEGNNSIQIEYTAVTPHREAEELNPIVYTNAANDFNFGFSTFAPDGKPTQAKANDPLGSNVVEVTIAPPKVKVGGDVWIDADSNGEQDDGDQSWYLNFDIVQNLIKNELGVGLNTSDQRNYQTSPTYQDGIIKETGSDPKNYGIAHFEFEELTSAKLRNGSTDYVYWNSDDTASKLIGKNPYTYNMVMNYSGSKFTKTRNIVDKRGSWIPIPNVSGTIPDKEQKDDNFNIINSTTFQTEQFFLHPTSEPDWDMTKDNGYNLLRTLNLTKTSMSTGEALEGAEFTIYGPFDHDTGKDQKLSDDNKVAVITTDKDGKASYGKLYSFIDPDADQELLFFFKEYVIVETKPAEGYSVEGAEADGANITKLDEGKWLLGVPKTDSEEQVEEVAVRDPGNIEVSVEKKWDDDEDAYGTRPESITVMLYTDESCTSEAKYADGKTVESRKLDESNKWRTTWEDLPRYKVVYGVRTPITYYVKETDSATGKDLNGYDVTIVATKDEETGNQHLEITNKPISTGLEVRKKWKDTKDIAASVTAVRFRVEQSADGENWTPVKRKGEEIYLTIERKSGETMGTAKVDDLPAYDADNNPLTYRAVETSITVNGRTLEVKDGKVGPYEVSEVHTPGKDASPEKATARDLSEITNTMVPTQFNVEKTFVDEFGISKGIKTVTVMLQRKVGNGKWTDVEKVDLTKWGGWKHTWKELPKYDWNGNAYDYRAVEVSYTTKKGNTVAVKYINNDKVAGTVGAYVYTATISGTADSGFTSHIENNLLIGALEVKKQWKDAKGKKIPDSLKITLKALADGKSISLSGVKKSTILDDSNDWADDTTWAELPVYTADGKLISYRLTESGKGKFTAEYKIKYNGEVIDEGDGETLDVTIYANDTVKATFINKPQGPPKTGDNAPLTGYLALCLISLVGLLMIFLRKWRRNN